MSMTIPVGTGFIGGWFTLNWKKARISTLFLPQSKNDPYFIHDETHVMAVPSVDALKDMGHGVDLTRKGVSGRTQNQRMSFQMSINNPPLPGRFWQPPPAR